MSNRLNQNETLQGILAEIEPFPEGEIHEFYGTGEISEQLPPPYMLVAIFLTAGKASYYPTPSEKVAWSLHFSYKGVGMRLEYRKFGLWFETMKKTDSTVLKSFVDVIRRAASVTDRILQPLIEEQIKQGRVTIRNEFNLLDGRYRFFRDLAEKAYISKAPPLKAIHFDNKGRPTAWGGDPRKPEREGFYYGSAAIDAYFSRFEHLLVLLLPFAGYDPVRDDLIKFIDSNWIPKMNRVFVCDSNEKTKPFYKQLRDVKERFRNPMSHGTFEKRGASLLIHAFTLGAIPIRLPIIRDKGQFSFYPLAPDSFEATCRVFDSVDEYIENGPLRFGYLYAKSGFNVAFAPEFLSEYRAASVSQESFEEMIERKSELYDRVMNMDW